MPPVRRLPRILLNAATAVSVVLFVATLGVWAKSRGGYPSASWAAAARSIHVSARDGTLWLVRAGWADDAEARRAAAGPARAARPVVVDPGWPDAHLGLETARTMAAEKSVREPDPARAKEFARR